MYQDIIFLYICNCLIIFFLLELSLPYFSPLYDKKEISEVKICAKEKMNYALSHYSKKYLMKEYLNVTNETYVNDLWRKTSNCLDKSIVYESYDIVKGNNVVAYVLMTYIYQNNIYIMKKKFKNMVIEDKASVLIHECTHLAWGSNDYAYIHEYKKFNNLRGNLAIKNADSHTLVIDMLSMFSC